MIVYRKIEGAKGGEPRYTKNNILTKTDRVPYEVVEKLGLGIPEVEVEEPTKLCTMCDGQANKERFYNGVMVPLCDHHYYNSSLGAIAQYLREHKEEDDGDNAKVSTTRGKKRESTSTKS